MSDEFTITGKCKHKFLVATDDFAGVEIDVKDSTSDVCGGFLYKKYKCLECNKIITVLNAVVENG